MTSQQLSAINRNKDFGVIMSKDTKPSQHWSEVETTNEHICFIVRAFENKSENIIYKLHTVLAPILQKNKTEKLEKVKNYFQYPMKEKLRIHLFSLTKRRLRSDQIKVF